MTTIKEKVTVTLRGRKGSGKGHEGDFCNPSSFHSLGLGGSEFSWREFLTPSSYALGTCLYVCAYMLYIS